MYGQMRMNYYVPLVDCLVKQIGPFLWRFLYGFKWQYDIDVLVEMEFCLFRQSDDFCLICQQLHSAENVGLLGRFATQYGPKLRNKPIFCENGNGECRILR